MLLLIDDSSESSEGQQKKNSQKGRVRNATLRIVEIKKNKARNVTIIIFKKTIF